MGTNDPKFSDTQALANSVDPAPRGAVRSGSTLFANPSALCAQFFLSKDPSLFELYVDYSKVFGCPKI